ncbi:unnamed protein product [Tilletia caries]|uniref:Uncharacterized protein n=1 Tax=Tilletia caries TaxID=13290 RepID=A0A177VGV0_9BASI|nr:hypothetical protein CF336_g277 [Tilletia laevis]KAE8206813.1 hypothetical protein CF335_g1594 [Tilletia laevis]KAE8265543.1 hypothetical protein A4X03_0g196 [Tilletia caries]CAD6888340.1 unnamed protein product [Tilletia caries]
MTPPRHLAAARREGAGAGAGGRTGSRRDLASQVTSLGNGTRVALKTGFNSGQQTYSMPVRIADQEFSLQIDTGSADLWVASTSCRDQSCRNKEGTAPTLLQLNDAFQAADSAFNITYLVGAASGPIYTADVTLGSQTIVKQAFAAADSVTNEGLGTGKFSGVLGLSLPANSIQQEILNKAEGTQNALNEQEDPSFTGSPLPGLWADAPGGSRYFGIGLQRRPEEGGVGDSIITFGVHDSMYAPDPSQIGFEAVIPDADQVPRHWRTTITEIVVSIGGNSSSSIPLGPSSVPNVATNGYPLAIIDSGAPISLGPPEILNSLYGAFGINPAENGGYYMPCSTQLNISLTMNGVVIPIHPLDASLYSGVEDADNCIGSFQAPSRISPSANFPADFIIAAPLMRSMYSVFTCEGITNPPPGQAGACRPRIGLLSTVTNKTKVQEDFYKVRVLKQALGTSSDDGDTLFQTSGLSSGVKILIGALSGLAFIGFLFLSALFLMKRRRKHHEKMIAASSAAEAKHASGLNGGYGAPLHRPNTLGGRRSTGFASRRHLSEASASAFGSNRSRSKMQLGADNDDEHFGYDPSLANNDDVDAEAATLAMDPKYRALAQMHGVYLDEVDDHLIGPSPARDPRGPRVGPFAPDNDPDPDRLGVGKSGYGVTSAESAGTYYEARAIRNDYLRRHPSVAPERGTGAGGSGGGGVAFPGDDALGTTSAASSGQGLEGEGGIPLANMGSSSGTGSGSRVIGVPVRNSALSSIPTGVAGDDNSAPSSSAGPPRIPDLLRLRPLSQYPPAAVQVARGSPEPLLNVGDLHEDEGR